jgi:hypothetical protein
MTNQAHSISLKADVICRLHQRTASARRTMARLLSGSWVGNMQSRNTGVLHALAQPQSRLATGITSFTYESTSVICRPSSYKSNSTRMLCPAALRSAT